ncbi:MAG TPA: substrate-binding domain-containing protein [Propionicimonas sp.]
MKRPILVAAVLLTVVAGCVGQPTAPSPTATASPSVPPSGTVSPSGTPASTQPSSTPMFAPGELPQIDGSTANIPLISLVIQRLTGVSKTEADNTVKTSGTPDAYRRLVEEDSDTHLLLVYEADEGVKAEISESGVALEFHPIGRDALVFFTNSSNPVTSLSTRQFRSIYTGKTTNWAQVGGRTAKIVAYQRPEESGSQALLRKYVVGRAKMAKAPSELVTADMGDIVSGVSSYANSGNALGYSVYYYLANMYAVDGITMLGVSGVKPSRETIADGSYPYTNDFYAVVRADEPAGSPARRVMEWLVSADGQQAVVDAGYVPAAK